ncbi:uncharacterized protein LOC131885091 isoform X2 [Tigriopus californicus]|uniref:uncharacterized protein LOC131885091 isoform X2 n=1 Tax=Tigriopus californicus TaxID=6832 RepID=UPI0027DAA9FA|nr:uncharacterized protein LOC131885091 isoform X2 [Tigriopus californicus]
MTLEKENNEGCVGSSSRNGTCYTPDECTTRGGSPAGTCAQGFGVCCVFTLACGGTTSENCTYLVQAGISMPTADQCTFTICKSSSNICRIKLDFTTFSIAGPTVGTASTLGNTNGGSIGDCTEDSFSLTSPGNIGSPLICGVNTGQHMIVDSSDICHRASFDFSGTTVSRQFDIKVTQYACGDEMGGPPGCLQYFTGNTGTFASFNFPIGETAVTADVTHLSNQCYTMCFRQEVGKCAICYNTVILGAADMAIDQGSFGLSISSAAIAIATLDTACSEDYLQIPGSGSDVGDADVDMFGPGTIPAILHERICGRFFGYETDGSGATDNTESICSGRKPFRVVFKTDSDEVLGDGSDDAEMSEQAMAPAGIVGFYLNYALQDC